MAESIKFVYLMILFISLFLVLTDSIRPGLVPFFLSLLNFLGYPLSYTKSLTPFSNFIFFISQYGNSFCVRKILIV
jgi:hypothetical protein